MDEAENGIIYLSLGSILQSRAFEYLGEIFINSLKNRPQRVIMKWNQKLISNIPSNFFIQKWLPQTAILSELILLYNIVYPNL